MKIAAVFLIPILVILSFVCFAVGRESVVQDGFLSCRANDTTTDNINDGYAFEREAVLAFNRGKAYSATEGAEYARDGKVGQEGADGGRHCGERGENPARPCLTEGEKKSAATLISSFSTTFDRSVYARSYNIALACRNFCYYVVPAGATLSFNGVVGRRTVERGYKEAKVIENGEYVPGVGGGVCQVSTTLYNAWITAGLGVVSVRAHSLPSSYCEMSRDATVSDFTDLVLINDSGADVIVNAAVTGNKVAFYVYGKPGEYTYGFESVLVRRTDPPEPVLEYVDYIEGGLESKQISPAKKGYVTELVRHVYLDGQEVEREVVRRDVYRGTAAKVLVRNSYD